MSQDYIKAIIKQAVKANAEWNALAQKYGDIKWFQAMFHLRPTSKNITIVSTLDKKPMRGIILKKNMLEELYLIMANETYNNQIELLEKMGFKDRNKNNPVEEKLQAQMVREMANNDSLKSLLKVDKLTFIASEFILFSRKDKEKENKKLRIDIIAYDGNKRVFFFELKEPENTSDNPFQQLKEYLDFYSVQKREDLVKVLKAYPINAVNYDDFIVEGYVVYGYKDSIESTISNIEYPDITGIIFEKTK